MRELFKIFKGLRRAFSDERVASLLVMTFTLIATASVFFWYIEGWSLLNSVYFSVMTISTVGYGDFTPQTVPGKVFTMFYVLCGLGIFIAAATALADQLISQGKNDNDN